MVEDLPFFMNRTGLHGSYNSETNFHIKTSKSDLFPSLMTGNEEDDDTRSSLYSSQMKSRSNDAFQNTLILSNFWPVWQPDGDEERLS